MFNSISIALSNATLGEWIGFSGFIVGLIGLILFIRSKKAIMICYRFSHINLLRTGNLVGIDKLEVKYDNKKIANLVRTNLILWNAGKKNAKKKRYF